jgi:hypothetical protein
MYQWMSGEILTGAISHSCGVLHAVGYFMGAIWKITHVGCPTGTILHGENEVFQSNRNDFPKVTYMYLKAYGGIILQLEVNKIN